MRLFKKKEPAKKPDRTWYVGKSTTKDSIDARIYNNAVRDNERCVIVIGEVNHNDPDFEQKWSDLLVKARRRCEVMNRGINFQPEEVNAAIAGTKDDAEAIYEQLREVDP